MSRTERSKIRLIQLWRVLAKHPPYLALRIILLTFTKKRQSARVCGKSCGIVPRNDRAFVPLAFILSLFLWTGCIHRKVEAPPRPSNVPQEAQWYGAADGGCWIIIHDTDTVNRFYVRCFFDGSGNLWEEGIYEVDTTVTKRTYTAEELRKVIIGYVGDDEVSVDNKQDSTQRNYGVLKKVR